MRHPYTKNEKRQKDYYRLLRILPTLSKCFGKCIFSQISPYFDEIFLKHEHGFRKGYITQQCLLILLEKWKAGVDKGKV